MNAPSPCYTLLGQVNGPELLQGNRYDLQTCPNTVSVCEQLAEIIDNNLGWPFSGPSSIDGVDVKTGSISRTGRSTALHKDRAKQAIAKEVLHRILGNVARRPRLGIIDELPVSFAEYARE